MEIRSVINYDESLSLYEKGREAMNDNRPWEAVELFEKSIGLYPHFKACELAGECCLSIGEPVKAIRYLSAAAGLGNNAFRARYLLAQALIALGDKELAIEKLQEALAMKEDYRRARQMLLSLTDDSDESDDDTGA